MFQRLTLSSECLLLLSNDSRLHDNEAAADHPKVVFSAWKWLTHEPVTDVLAEQKKQEDALYALGVAGLASKQLLQKHHIPLEKTQTMKAVDMRPTKPVIDVPAEAPITSMVPATATKSAVILNEVSQVLARLSDSRKSLHKYQSNKLKAAVAFCVRGPVKLCRSLWKFGGGKKNVTRTLAFAVALTFILVRPLAHFVASEGLNMTRGV
jgi:hypothetical protein